MNIDWHYDRSLHAANKNSHLAAAFDDRDTASVDEHKPHWHYCHMGAWQQKRAASLVAVIAASIAFVVVVVAAAAAASALAVIGALTERFAAVSVSAVVEVKPVTVDYDPVIAWNLVSEESVV